MSTTHNQSICLLFSYFCFHCFCCFWEGRKSIRSYLTGIGIMERKGRMVAHIKLSLIEENWMFRTQSHGSKFHILFSDGPHCTYKLTKFSFDLFIFLHDVHPLFFLAVVSVGVGNLIGSIHCILNAKTCDLVFIIRFSIVYYLFGIQKFLQTHLCIWYVCLCFHVCVACIVSVWVCGCVCLCVYVIMTQS